MPVETGYDFNPSLWDEEVPRDNKLTINLSSKATPQYSLETRAMIDQDET